MRTKNGQPFGITNSERENWLFTKIVCLVLSVCYLFTRVSFSAKYLHLYLFLPFNVPHFLSTLLLAATHTGIQNAPQESPYYTNKPKQSQGLQDSDGLRKRLLFHFLSSVSRYVYHLPAHSLHYPSHKQVRVLKDVPLPSVQLLSCERLRLQGSQSTLTGLLTVRAQRSHWNTGSACWKCPAFKTMLFESLYPPLLWTSVFGTPNHSIHSAVTTCGTAASVIAVVANCLWYRWSCDVLKNMLWVTHNSNTLSTTNKCKRGEIRNLIKLLACIVDMLPTLSCLGLPCM